MLGGGGGGVGEPNYFRKGDTWCPIHVLGLSTVIWPEHKVVGFLMLLPTCLSLGLFSSMLSELVPIAMRDWQPFHRYSGETVLGYLSSCEH